MNFYFETFASQMNQLIDNNYFVTQYYIETSTSEFKATQIITINVCKFTATRLQTFGEPSLYFIR